MPATQGTTTPFGWRIGGPGLGMDVVLAARVRENTGPVADALRREMAAIAPNVPLSEAGTLLDIQLGAGATRVQAVYGHLVRVVGGYGIVLALLGIVAAITQAGVERTREMGIRSALGARPYEAHLLLVRDAAIATGLGLASGVLVLFGFEGAISRLLGNLQGASITDPLALAGISAAVLVTTIGTALTCARRVGRANPAVALRSD